MTWQTLLSYFHYSPIFYKDLSLLYTVLILTSLFTCFSNCQMHCCTHTHCYVAFVKNTHVLIIHCVETFRSSPKKSHFVILRALQAKFIPNKRALNFVMKIEIFLVIFSVNFLYQKYTISYCVKDLRNVNFRLENASRYAFLTLLKSYHWIHLEFLNLFSGHDFQREKNEEVFLIHLKGLKFCSFS